MVTIKDVAMLSETSLSTASIVLRGDGDKRKISKKTQDKVRQAAKILCYQPNIAARRLRNHQPVGVLSIAVYWADDFRLPMAVRFMRGLQEAIQSKNLQVEFSFFIYHNDNLSAQTSLANSTLFNAIIICNASQKDMIFLEETDFPVPIVLYNRHSKQHCTVNVNDEKIGKIPARIFAELGHKRCAAITSYSVFPGMDVRTQAFLLEAQRNGMAAELPVETENSMAGGFRAAEMICKLSNRPDCVFCASDAISIGVLHYLNLNGISVPGDLELISLGNGDQEQAQYTFPPLSVVLLPIENMAKACLELILSLINGEITEARSIKMPITYIARGSCRDSKINLEDI